MRGTHRRKIFFDDADRDDFWDRLGGILSGRKTPCFAWASMPNHLHSVLRTGAAPIVTVIRRLLTGYALSFNPRIIVALGPCFRIATPVKGSINSIPSKVIFPF
ncbi:MAG: hypothetical protein JSW39_15325 [Desulfobacterales bacterium]|nr:MAG: hypothetical protein JSW39_15325 [Desulfobacterales bacterium]